MPEPEWIEIQKDLAALTARVAAFEQAQRREEEPPMLTAEQDDALRRCWNPTAVAAVDRLRWCEAELARLQAKNENCRKAHDAAWEEVRKTADELARLREGLKVQEGDVNDEWIRLWHEPVHGYDSNFVAASREIQRHRALVGGGK